MLNENEKKRGVGKIRKEDEQEILQTIRAFILKGFSKKRILQELRQIYSAELPKLKSWYDKALEEMLSEVMGDPKRNEKIREVQNVRLEELLDRAMDNNNIKAAREVIDTINKLYGLYELKQKVEITDAKITFNFANEIPVDEDKKDE